MLKMDEFFEVRQLIKQGKTDTQIGRELGISRATVRKYRKSNTPPKYKPRDRPSRVDPVAPYEDQIRAWIAGKGDIRGTALFDILKGNGYQGSLRAIQRRTAQIKKQLNPPELFFEQEYTFGEQSQFDFKETVKIPFIHGEEICHLFVGTLPASGKYFVKAYPNKRFVAFADGMYSFFEFIGGITENIRFDNLKPAVERVLKGSDRIYTKSFERLYKYLGVNPSPCRPRKGSDKGDVEREIKNVGPRVSDYIYLEKLSFKGFKELNDWLFEFSDHFMSDKAKALFLEEQKHLRPCPPREESIVCEVSTPLVNKHGTVLIKKSRYSCPNIVIDQTVKAVVSAFDVKIYDPRASVRRLLILSTFGYQRLLKIASRRALFS